MKKLNIKNRKNEKNTTQLPVPTKVKRGFRLYAVSIMALTLMMSMAMPAFAATTDPLTVVNNLSDFIFGLIRAVGLEECGFFESIPLWAVTLIGSLFITVLSFVMIMTVYGRFFRMYLYTAIAPVPLATFAGEPSQSVGISFPTITKRS